MSEASASTWLLSECDSCFSASKSGGRGPIKDFPGIDKTGAINKAGESSKTGRVHAARRLNPIFIRNTKYESSTIFFVQEHLIVITALTLHIEFVANSWSTVGSSLEIANS